MFRNNISSILMESGYLGVSHYVKILRIDYSLLPAIHDCVDQ